MIAVTGLVYSIDGVFAYLRDTIFGAGFIILLILLFFCRGGR